MDRDLYYMENLGVSMEAITDQTLVKMLFFKKIHGKSNDSFQILLDILRNKLRLRQEKIEPQAIYSTIATIYYTLNCTLHGLPHLILTYFYGQVNSSWPFNNGKLRFRMKQ